MQSERRLGFAERLSITATAKKNLAAATLSNHAA